MDSKTEALKATALEKGDHSQLCTKNIDGQMFLVLASELKSTSLKDNGSETDSDCEILDYDPEVLDYEADITVALLDEKGQEMEEVSVKDKVSRSGFSVPDILKNLPTNLEYISRHSSRVTWKDSAKLLPGTNSKENLLQPPHKTFIIKTSVPLSSIDLKSLICTGFVSNLVSNNQVGKTPESLIISKTNSAVHAHVSSYHTTQAFTSSTPAISLSSPKPITTTPNLALTSTSSGNQMNSSLLNKILLQEGRSLALNANPSAISAPVCANSQPVQTVTVPTASNQLIQPFPIVSTNVIKPLNPVLDAGPPIPKVQISNNNMLGTLITSVTSQSLTSGVQSKPFSNPQFGQFVKISLPSNSGSAQMAPCMFFSTSGNATLSSSDSVAKKPIVHTGVAVQSLVSSRSQEPGEGSLIYSKVSSALPSGNSTLLFAPINSTSMVQNTLQPNTTLTTSICKPLVCINKTDSTLNRTAVTAVVPTSAVSSTSSLSLSLSSASASSSSSFLLTIPKVGCSSTPSLIKILPKTSSSTTESNLTLPADRLTNSVALAKYCAPCITSISDSSDEELSPLDESNAKNELKQTQVYRNITINGSLPASTFNPSSINFAEAKPVSTNKQTNGTNIKSIKLMTPTVARSIFSTTTTSPESVKTVSNVQSLNNTSDVDLQNDPVTKISDDSNSEKKDPVIVLLKPLISKSDTVSSTTTTTTTTTTTSCTDSNSSLNGQEPNLKEKTSSLKSDDNIQFLKLGSLANNDSTTVKKELLNNNSKIANDLIDGKTNDLSKPLDSSLLKLPGILANNGESVSVKLKPFSDSNQNLKQLSDNDNSTTSETNFKPNSSAVNLKSIYNNSNVIKIPTSLINGRQVITIPTQLQVPPTAPAVTLSNRKPSSQFVQLASKPTTNPQVLTSPLSAVTLSSQAMTGTQFATLSSQPGTATLSGQATTGTKLVKLASSLPTGTQLVTTLSSSTPTGTQLITLPAQSEKGAQLVGLSSQLPKGTRLLKLPAQLQAGTQFIPLSGQGQQGTQLVKLTGQHPASTQLVTVPNQGSTGPQFIALTGQNQKGGPQLVKLANPSATGPSSITPNNQVPTGTQLVTVTNQATNKTQLITLPTPVLSSPPVVTLASQTQAGPPQIVSLTNQASANQQFVSLINQAVTNTQLLTLANQNLPGAGQMVKLPNQTLAGGQLIKLPAQITHGMKLQTLPSTPVLNMNLTNSASSNIQIRPANKMPLYQLNQSANLSVEPVSKTPSTNNGQTLAANPTNISNSSGTLAASCPAQVNDIIQKLQKGESCAVVISHKNHQSGLPLTSMTTTTSGHTAVPMQSLLAPKQAAYNLSPKSLLELPVSPSKNPQKTSERPQTNTEETDDMPMTLKIDSIFSLKDEENQDLSYWEGTASDNPVNSQAEIGCDSIGGLTSAVSTPSRNDKSIPIQVVLSNNEKDQIELKTLSSPHSKPIVYARLNKPKLLPRTSPIQLKHYKIHDLSNHFPTSQRKKMLDISHIFKSSKMVSIRKKAHKAKSFEIKSPIHIKDLKNKKYAFLQPRVMIPQLYIPARRKSLNVFNLPVETQKSLKCEPNCIHRVRLTYPASSLLRSFSPPPNEKFSPQSAQHFRVLKVDGKNIISPYFHNLGTKTNYVLKDSSNVSASSSLMNSQTLFLKQGFPISTNHSSASLTRVPVSLSSLKNISPLKIHITSPTEQNNSTQKLSDLSPNKDCLELACGIIQDNTLKRKSSSSINLGDEDVTDTDWSMDLEMSYKSKRKKKMQQVLSNSTFC